VTLGLGYALPLFPADLSDLGQSVLALSFLASNIFFMRREGYFAAPSESSPLLHTWTLSIEEQFYVLLPVIFFLIWKFCKNKMLVLFSIIGLLSFAYNVYLVNIAPLTDFAIPLIPDFVWGDTLNQAAGFYLLLTRAWEFILGVILSLTSLSIKNSRAAEVISTIGFIAILYAVVQFDKTTAFPGIAALVPALGSVAIIASNTERKTFIGKVLSLPMMLWVGLLSYSLYLWHWPVFVYSNALLFDKTAIQSISLIIISFVLAWISYIFIETPGRNLGRHIRSGHVIVLGMSGLLVLAIAGYHLERIDISAKIPEHANKFFVAKLNTGEKRTECYAGVSANDYIASGPCRLGDTSTSSEKIDFVLWGDSHAAANIDMLDELATAHNLHGVFFGNGGCVPVDGIIYPPQTDECQKIKKLALKFITDNDIQNVILIARWNLYLNLDESRDTKKLREIAHETSEADMRITFEENLGVLVNQLVADTRNVLILKQVPHHTDFKPRKLFYQSIRLGETAHKDLLPLRMHVEQNKYAEQIFKNLAHTQRVTIIDPAEIFCTSGTFCIFETAKEIVYRDADHVNIVGSKMLMPLFQEHLIK
jgi:peptidoglycan/LPS O-acetylase OafA/YrhL